jgi:uncharacterized protein (DUF2236 family)
VRPRGVGGYTPDSAIWRLHSEPLILLGGGRVLLIQAAHPLALAGFLAHSTYDRDPWNRLWRTSRAFGDAIFGEADEAEEVGRRVRAMHRRIRGRTRERFGPFPAGTPYAADAPDLLEWVHTTFVENTLTTYQRLVRTLSREEQDAYVRDTRPLGRLFGVPEERLPATAADVYRYVGDMLSSDTIVVTSAAHETARRTVLGPPLPLHLRPLWPAVNAVTAALLPPSIRAGYGIGWDPVRDAAFSAWSATLRHGVVRAVPARVRLEVAAQALKLMPGDYARGPRARAA